jgi:two-component system response regulator AtoC
MLHDASPRAAMPFLEASCASDDAEALAADLFGSEEGGDQGPRARRPGLFELGEGGTLFLDEIGLLPSAVQLSLVEALETHIVRRVGGSRALRVDVRPVAATSLDVGAAIRAGRFAEDLFLRLRVVPLHLLPVRERPREDREALLERLVAELRVRIPGSPARLAPDAAEGFLAYAWPGNVREMRAVLERALLLARGVAAVGAQHLPPEIGGSERAAAPRGGVSLDEVEHAHIERILLLHGGNRTHAAEALGISRATLITKIKTYGLDL